eukprot:CAMPEP_0114343166 /NCGR_PEP_ID=MMETSP0101-20121206/10382_1 /TAXON_ID=38822 ORGANISM="Pteridomonas danica, Strain PT" /NCGR_SAMPLE_ID=MMETSP0101 /ASSEMBLY_ACC=CAM_ASM_000211 /LENGTH=38 /DNA_ID= /DNA_START= /DNA_END= /DNA_ORIENTATION=
MDNEYFKWTEQSPLRLSAFGGSQRSVKVVKMVANGSAV